MKLKMAPSLLWRAFLGLLTIIGLAYFFDALLRMHGSGGISWPENVSYSWLALSCFLGVIHLVCMAGIFALFLNGESRGRVGSVYLSSQFAKYVPGRIWGMMAQKALLGQEGQMASILGANVLITSMLLASQVAAIAASTIFLIFGAIPALLAGFLICIGAGIAASVLESINMRANWRILAPWSKPNIVFITIAGTFASLALTVTAWIALYYGAFGFQVPQAVGLQAVSSASFIAGMFSLLPAGLGLREGFFVALNPQSWDLPLNEMASLALVTRVWLLAIDAIALVAGLSGLLWFNRKGLA